MQDDRIGIEFTTNEGYQVIVIDYVNSKKVQVMFLDEHKYKMWTEWSNLKRGNVKNPFHPSVYGVGYLGADGKGQTGREYKVWQNMLQRCYDVKFHDKRPTYEKCTICERWHNYSLFLEDLPKIKNYEYWRDNPQQKIALNKDIYYAELGIETDCKEYNLETTRFITKSENSKESAERSELGKTQHKARLGRKVKCIETQVVYESISEASRKTGLPQGNICNCCNGKKGYKTCGGYHWEFVD